EMVMVLKITGLALAKYTRWATSSAKPLICILQGGTWLPVETTPTCGRLQSSSLKPTARSTERAGAFCRPSTKSAEYFRPVLFFLDIATPEVWGFASHYRLK